MPMSWDALAAVADVVAAMAVVLSVIYLALQVRQSTRIAKVSAQREVVNALRDVMRPLVQDPELSRIFAEGIEDFDALRTDERIRFFHLAFQFGKAWESAHYHYQHGLFDRDVWEAWSRTLSHYVGGPGWKRYWSLRRDVYAPAFQRFVDTLPIPDRRITPGTLTAVLESEIVKQV